MKKKLFSLCLALCLAATLLPSALAYAPSESGGFSSVSTGYAHGLAVKTDGALWAWGNNQNGQVGNGKSGKGTLQLVPIHVMDDVVSVSAGYGSSAAIKTDGSLWIWGDVDLATRIEGNSHPVKVMDGVAAVSCGLQSYFAVKTDGTLWAWGSNHHNQLGNGGEGTRNDPSNPAWRVQDTPVQIMTNVKAVSAADDYTLALKNDGSLWSWGRGSAPLGLGADPTIRDYLTDASYFPDDPKLPSYIQHDFPYPVKVMTGIQSICAGYNNTMVIKADGTLWTWGGNHNGQLGNGTQLWYDSPVQSETVRINGKPYSFGISVFQLQAHKIMSHVVSVSGGGGGGVPQVYTSFAIQTDGSLWAWGSAYLGQLGRGNTGNAIDGTGRAVQTVPLKVMDGVAQVSGGAHFTAAVKKDGTLWTWGANQLGELGNNGAVDTTASGGPATTQLVPKQILTNVGVNVLQRSAVQIDGNTTDLSVYMVTDANGGGTTYFKLRDLAMLLSGSGKGFSVAWDQKGGAVNIVVGQLYTVWGGELTMGSAASAVSSRAKLLVDGRVVPCSAYLVSQVEGAPGNNYFKLRDIAKAVGFYVGWDQASSTVIIDSSRGYTA